MDPEILHRIRRLYVSFGRTVELDLSKFPAEFQLKEPGRFVFMQNFSGGRSEPELNETLHGLINNVASFHDHLKKWGRAHGISEDTVHNFLKSSLDFCIVRDLWNNDKHGYPPLDGKGWSKKAPRLTHARCVCQLKTGVGKSTAGMTFGKNGQPVPFGNGTVQVTVTGEIVDKNGAGLGEAHEILQRAVGVCEAALVKFGVTQILTN